jgi:hypothetical protein
MSNGAAGSNQAFADFSNSQEEILSNLSFFLGALSSIDPEPDSSAVLKIASIAAKLGSLFSTDPVQGAINDLAIRMHDMFAALQALDAATAVQTRTTWLNASMRHTSEGLTNITNSIQDPTNWPVSVPISQIEDGLGIFLSDDDLIWNITYALADFQKIYWNDTGRQSVCYYLVVNEGFRADTDNACYGLQSPPLNADGVTVFEYRAVLPLYLWVITSFLSTVALGRRRDPNLLAQVNQDLVDAKNKLQGIYDRITTPGNGLTALSPPDWTTTSLQELVCPIPVDGAPPPRPAVQLLYGGTGQPPNVVGGVIEYGAVEKYSGNSSIGDGYQINLSSPADMQDPAIFNKLQIRVLKHKKDLYQSSGLPVVLQAINYLKHLIGEALVPGIAYTDWSLREVLALARLPPSGNAQSLRQLARFLVQTQPLDTPYGATFPHLTVSMRQLLTNVPH